MNTVSDSTIDFTLVNAVSCSFFQCQGVSNFNKECTGCSSVARFGRNL